MSESYLTLLESGQMKPSWAKFWSSLTGHFVIFHLNQKVLQQQLFFKAQHKSKGKKHVIHHRSKMLFGCERQSYVWYNSTGYTYRCKGLTGVTRESDTSFSSGPFASALKGYCIPGSSGPHSCPLTLALFNTGLHSLNSKLNPPSGLLGMTDMVNIVESVCQDPGSPALPEQETHSQNIVPRWKMRPGTTAAEDGNIL